MNILWLGLFFFWSVYGALFKSLASREASGIRKDNSETIFKALGSLRPRHASAGPAGAQKNQRIKEKKTGETREKNERVKMTAPPGHLDEK